ncbi:helix-turn-helix domain-containing protein [Nocardia carnea]|nr:helix-turn-helix domain-containing protein [Nocardia carnea]
MLERGEIVRVLTDHQGTMSQAAAELGMSRATLFRKLSQYGISQR